MRLTFLYRGPLSSCNYACEYCPFAKRRESDAEHGVDALALERFVSWIAQRPDDEMSVFFTPWGEALIRKRYQQAMVRLSRMAHVRKVVIQTNLSCRLDWVEECDLTRMALWATYHPGEVSRNRFLDRCLELDRRGANFSVGVVGLKEHLGEIEALRGELPPHVYLWVNAFKRVPDYYAPSELIQLEAVDPLFPLNNQRHPSLGHACRTGNSVLSVDGDGNLRRCHFVQDVIGNLYRPGWEHALRDRPCPNETCGCHIGYAHLDYLQLGSLFGDGLLERIPTRVRG